MLVCPNNADMESKPWLLVTHRNSRGEGGGIMRFANRCLCIVKWLTSANEDYMYKQKVFIFLCDLLLDNLWRG